MDNIKTPLNLYNTADRGKSEVTLRGDQIGMYACGPTVYNYAHIGNLKTYVVEDVLKRSLMFLGYPVKHVMNITDVGHLSDDGDHGDDKMEVRARETGKSVWDIADFYTQAFMTDLDRLNILKPQVFCKATDHIADMIEMISTLEDKGFAYEAEGNVYFDISKFPDYGKMARLKLEDQQAGARVEVDGGKRGPYDFALWFTKSKFEDQAMKWDSPWGVGYPGWHIECSAMSRKYLGDQFDIHCGGTDHIPVHHTNEIAQSEATTGKSPWVRHWFHSAFLNMVDGKMSKSSGNFLTIDSLAEMGYDPMDYRYLLLGANYRTMIQYSDDNLQSAKTARRKLVERIRELPIFSDVMTGRGDAILAGSDESWSSNAASCLAEFTAAVADDLNTPKALSVLWGLIKNTEISPEEKRILIHLMDRVFGLGLDAIAPEEQETDEDGEISSLIDERNAARASRNFARADEIRDELASRGIVLIDTPSGTTWKKNV